jgi:hypothetical protein
VATTLIATTVQELSASGAVGTDLVTAAALAGGKTSIVAALAKAVQVAKPSTSSLPTVEVNSAAAADVGAFINTSTTAGDASEAPAATYISSSAAGKSAASGSAQSVVVSVPVVKKKKITPTLVSAPLFASVDTHAVAAATAAVSANGSPAARAVTASATTAGMKRTLDKFLATSSKSPAPPSSSSTDSATKPVSPPSSASKKSEEIIEIVIN